MWVRNMAARRAVRGERAHVHGDPRADPQRARAEHRAHLRARRGAPARQGCARTAVQRRREPEQRRRPLHRQDRDAHLGRHRLRGTGAARRRRGARSAPARRLRRQHDRRQPNHRGAARRPSRRARAAANEAFFSSDRKWSGLAFADGDARGTYVLGAPEVLAPVDPRRRRLARARGRVGRARPARRTVRRADRAGAFRRRPTSRPACPPSLEALALVAFSDELRPGVRQTLEGFSDAGIDVKIISGDNPKTVVALATQAGVQSLQRRQGVDAYCESLSARRRCAAEGGPAPGRRRRRRRPPTRELVAVSGADLAELSPQEFARRGRRGRASSAASRPSRSRTSSRPCASAGATSR